MNHYGDKVKYYRNRLKLTQEDLGARIGVTKSFISKIEKSHTDPSLETMCNIASALQVDIGALLTDRISVESVAEWDNFIAEMNEKGITPEELRKYVNLVNSIKDVIEVVGE